MRHEDGSEEELRGQAEALTAELGERVSRVRETVAAFVDEHPLAAVGIAFGAGYVVAGGLVSKMTGRLLKFGTRLAMGAVLRQAMVQIPAMMLAQREAGGEATGRTGPSVDPTQRH